MKVSDTAVHLVEAMQNGLHLSWWWAVVRWLILSRVLIIFNFFIHMQVEVQASPLFSLVVHQSISSTNPFSDPEMVHAGSSDLLNARGDSSE